MSGLTERLKARAKLAREEQTGTALGDALHFEEAAATIESLDARLASARKALEEINNKIPHNIRCKCEACCICNIATAALSALTDEKGQQ